MTYLFAVLNSTVHGPFNWYIVQYFFHLFFMCWWLMDIMKKLTFHCEMTANKIQLISGCRYHCTLPFWHLKFLYQILNNLELMWPKISLSSCVCIKAWYSFGKTNVLTVLSGYCQTLNLQTHISTKLLPFICLQPDIFVGFVFLWWKY